MLKILNFMIIVNFSFDNTSYLDQTDHATNYNLS